MKDTYRTVASNGRSVRLATTDVEEHVQFWRRAGSDNRIDQLGAGRFAGSINAVLAAGGAVVRATVGYNRLVRVRGGVKRGRVALVLDFAGHGRLTAAGRRPVGPAGALVYGAGAEADVAWDSVGFGALSCERDLVREAARRIAGADLALTGYRELDAAAAPRAAAALDRLKGGLRAVEDGAAGPWCAAATASLIDDVVGALAGAGAQAAEPRETPSAARLRQAEEFLQAHAHEPVALAALCGALGVPERTLRADFRAKFGMGPIAYLRRLRLNGARRALRDGRAASVTEAAMAWGFYHLGEFAAAYKAQFGEPPSGTLRSAGRSARSLQGVSPAGRAAPVMSGLDSALSKR